MINYVWKSMWVMTDRMDHEGQRVEMELVDQIVKDLNLEETNRDKGDKTTIRPMYLLQRRRIFGMKKNVKSVKNIKRTKKLEKLVEEV